MIKRAKEYLINIVASRFVGVVVKDLIIVLLAIVCTCNVSYYLGLYLSDDKTIVTTAQFYGEHHQQKKNHALLLPRFTLCFSKVLTYNQLTTSDIKLLYKEAENISSLQKNLSDYAWKVKVQTLVQQVKFGSKVERAERVFESIFYSPTVSCWQTKKNYKVFATRPGHYNTLQLIINAAVYDDLMVDYDSPIVYLSIIPFTGLTREEGIGALSNNVAISPGRYSSVGFQVKKTESAHRNKRDARQCDSSGSTPGICIASRSREGIRSNCSTDVDNTFSNVLNFYACAMRQEHVHGSICQIEPCSYETYRFTKSEGFIKYDKKLSVLNVSDDLAREMATDVANAMQLDSQYNPWKRSSFLNLAIGIDSLTYSIADHLSMPSGFKCNALLNNSSNMVKLEVDKIPDVKKEFVQMKIIVTQFVSRCRSLYTKFIKLAHEVTATLTSPCILIVSPIVSTLYESYNAQPCLRKSCYYPICQENLSSLVNQSRSYGNSLNTLWTLLSTMRSLSVAVTSKYEQLEFTSYIKTFSRFSSGSHYLVVLQDALEKINTVTNSMFQGLRSLTGTFAHDDGPVNIDARSPSECKSWLHGAIRNQQPKTISDVGKARAWNMIRTASAALNLQACDCMGMHYTGSRLDAVIGHPAKVTNIPAFVYMYCGGYQNTLANAERYFNTAPSYSLGSTDSRFSLPLEYSVYALGALLGEYDTANLFSVGSGGIDHAERRACHRLVGIPSYNRLCAAGCQKDGVHATYLLPTHTFPQMIGDCIVSLSAFDRSSTSFSKYYKAEVVPGIQQMHDLVNSLRETVQYYQNSVTKNANHKIFLINRLKRLSSLVHEAVDGGGEAKVSEYLTKKGTILIGEIRIELAEMQHTYERNKAIFNHHWQIIRNIRARINLNNQSVVIGDDIFRGLMTLGIHATKDGQLDIIDKAESCVADKWWLAKEKHEFQIRVFTNWIVNVTAMVRRTRRYTDSLLLSNDFVRKNMMYVALYFDSLQILTETSQRKFSLKDFFANFANVASVHLRLTMFSVLQLVCFLIAFAAKHLSRQRLNKVKPRVMALQE